MHCNFATLQLCNFATLCNLDYKVWSELPSREQIDKNINEWKDNKCFVFMFPFQSLGHNDNEDGPKRSELLRKIQRRRYLILGSEF